MLKLFNPLDHYNCHFVFLQPVVFVKFNYSLRGQNVQFVQEINYFSTDLYFLSESVTIYNCCQNIMVTKGVRQFAFVDM